MNKKTKVDSRGKRIGMFVLKTIVYLTSVHFIYNEF